MNAHWRTLTITFFKIVFIIASKSKQSTYVSRNASVDKQFMRWTAYTSSGSPFRAISDTNGPLRHAWWPNMPPWWPNMQAAELFEAPHRLPGLILRAFCSEGWKPALRQVLLYRQQWKVTCYRRRNHGKRHRHRVAPKSTHCMIAFKKLKPGQINLWYRTGLILGRFWLGGGRKKTPKILETFHMWTGWWLHRCLVQWQPRRTTVSAWDLGLILTPQGVTEVTRYSV